MTSGWGTCVRTDGSIIICRGCTARSVFASKSSNWESSWTPRQRRTVSRLSDCIKKRFEDVAEMLISFVSPFVGSHLRLHSLDILQGEQKISLHYQFTWWYVLFQRNQQLWRLEFTVIYLWNVIISCRVQEFKWKLTQCHLFLCAVQFSSLKTETEKIQAQKDQLQAELLAIRTELDGLRVALSHVQNTNKALTNDKVNPVSLVFIHRVWVNSGGRGNNCGGLCECQAGLHQQCLELRSQVISLRSQVDTSQTVQRDFVQLSQSLQVLEQIKKIKMILGLPPPELLLPPTPSG